MNFQEIVAAIAAYKELDPSSITADTLLVEDLGLDSLDTVELLMSFEDKLGITLEMSEPIKSVGEVAAFIQKAAKDA